MRLSSFIKIVACQRLSFTPSVVTMAAILLAPAEPLISQKLQRIKLNNVTRVTSGFFGYRQYL
jgi:hypothetical protein